MIQTVEVSPTTRRGASSWRLFNVSGQPRLDLEPLLARRPLDILRDMARNAWAADAPANSRCSYWVMLPPTSCPRACHSFQYFQPPQNLYRPESDGTRYVLREKVRFFEPFRYGASWVEVHEASS